MSLLSTNITIQGKKNQVKYELQIEMNENK